MNPLLIDHRLPFDAVAFDKIKEEDFMPALDEAILKAEKEIESYVKASEVSFQSVVEGLDQISEDIDHISSIFYSLYSAHATEKLRGISAEFSKKLTSFSNKITLDERVFKRVKSLYEARSEQELTPEQSQILNKYYDDFVRHGALLEDDKKEQLKKINEELSSLSLSFSDNVLSSSNSLFLHVEDENRLTGVPENVKEEALERAKGKELSGWVFSLDYPSYLPFMTYCKDRELRKEFYEINSKKASEGKWDNSSIVKREVSLRIKKANLLGYKTHAEYILEKRMAETPERVLGFLEEFYNKAKPAALNDFKKIEDLAKEMDDISQLERWDTAYYSEILKKRELEFDDELLRPYFPLNQVIDGLFQVANKLYGIEFKKIENIPVYHEEVETYEVRDEKTGEHVGLFYLDLFPRETKKQGAWMTCFREQGFYKGEVRRPLVVNVCNFTKPTRTKPSLLALYEVLTLFHEFGHGLHGLLSKCYYRSLSGTNVYWDFVELPSQIMENWVKEKDCLDLFAAHYETGEKIPKEILEKIKDSNQFLEGMSTLRQTSFGSLDMAWHTLTEVPEDLNVGDFERKALEKFDLYKSNDEKSVRSNSFGHLFAGGYSAGYYSYKWAEVLDADAFEFFKEKGIFNKEVSGKFKKFILEKGGTEPPLELYKKFRGREPKIEALLKRAGLL